MDLSQSEARPSPGFYPFPVRTRKVKAVSLQIKRLVCLREGFNSNTLPKYIRLDQGGLHVRTLVPKKVQERHAIPRLTAKRQVSVITLVMPLTF